ncbi:hypothetical protein OIO90_004467 [Microbotryomycetes sp. JL221]|nr:hypothetical protein OIO90_004467 [Microbotryomycetes sp. JL221]
MPTSSSSSLTIWLTFLTNRSALNVTRIKSRASHSASAPRRAQVALVTRSKTINQSQSRQQNDNVWYDLKNQDVSPDVGSSTNQDDLPWREMERTLYPQWELAPKSFAGLEAKQSTSAQDDAFLDHKEHVYHETDTDSAPDQTELEEWFTHLQTFQSQSNVKDDDSMTPSLMKPKTRNKMATSTRLPSDKKGSVASTTPSVSRTRSCKATPTIEEQVKKSMTKKRTTVKVIDPAIIVPKPSAQLDSPIQPYRPSTAIDSNMTTQPHDRLVLSRHDWRLSSPLVRHSRTLSDSPPSLYERVDLTCQGHNKLVGVGVDPARVGSWSPRLRAEEQWGWKIKVPNSEKADWPAANVHRKKLDRLLKLSAEAEEKFYLEQLAKQGPPWQRELQGKTVCQAKGQWLTDSSKAIEMMSLSVEDKRKLIDKANQGSGGGKAIAAWSQIDGRHLTEENGYQFVPGTVLRFTPLSSDKNRVRGGPELPTSAVNQVTFKQGDLLDIKDGQLIVAFEEIDMWILNDEDEYRIDIGNDDTSYKLQSRAIDNLYFSPMYQRQHNANVVEAAQLAHADGVTTTLREWALQGTDIRELIVPTLDMSEQLDAQRIVNQDLTSTLILDDDDGSPASELAHLPPVTLPLPFEPRPNATNPSSLFADNQLINSWIKRHSRDDPIKMEGDPLLNLNESQTKAVAMALGQSMSLIQGPPGTGKSATIVSMIALLKLHFRIPQPILLAAPTHVSIDHLLSLLVKSGLNPLRTGKVDKVRPDLQQWTVEKRREQHPLWNTLEQAREASEQSRIELQEFQDNKQGSKLSKEELEREIELETKYRKSWRKFIVLEHRLYSSLFATANVFCSTAIGAGASKVMNMVDFPIVFLDEAAMCTEPVSLIPLMKGAQHVCFIGDHKQLPAVVKSRDAVKERLHVSLFERLMAEQSVQCTLLDTQYRMRPSISAFPNQAFYYSQLQDSNSVQSTSSAIKSSYFDPSQPTVFLSHTRSEETFRQSTINVFEAEIIVEVVGDLLLKNSSLKPDDIGIISPYFAQTCLLQDMFQGKTIDHQSKRSRKTYSTLAQDKLKSKLNFERLKQLSKVEINTVDGFQGREKQIIIFSTVRSNKHGFIGFLSDQRRLNVALTRAKQGLIVVGNRQTLMRAVTTDWNMGDKDADAGVWRRYLKWMDERGLVKDWHDAKKVTVARRSPVVVAAEFDDDDGRKEASEMIVDVDDWIMEEHGGQDDVDSRDLYL